MQRSHCTGINLKTTDNDTDVFIKLLMLLYADDTVLLGTDAESFQHNLNAFYEYSQQWKLNVNYSKMKIIIFGIRDTSNHSFKLGDNNIEICDEFKYLGVIFTKHRSFFKAIKHNIDHARKALHLLYKRINNLQIPIDLQIQLFDHTILPLLLYGCEVWGYQNTKMLDAVYNQFLRSITKLRKSTPVYMLYAELGRTPIEIQIKTRMIGFWISLVNGNNSKFSRKLYNIMLTDSGSGRNYKWINYIKNILISVGKPDLINQPFINNPQATKAKIVKSLNDLYVQRLDC